MHFSRFLFVLFCVALVAPLSGAAWADQPVTPDHAEKMARGQELFRKQLRKVFIERCLKCHGGEKTRSGLDLASRDGLLKGGDNGTVVIPGKSKESRLVKMVNHIDEKHMPPQEPMLPAEQRSLLASWIDLGAPYDKPLIDKAITSVKKTLVVTDKDRQFWSFQSLKRPAVPAVKNEGWVRNPVDRFILARLEQKGLAPNASAEKRKLIRRLYFDLIGLPPTPEEVESFLKDESPQAYEKVVDRLLVSPHHGERWARHWLDIVRFAESHGFEHDYDRPSAYHYRDFVIKALNQDLPYDTFVKWQLAGDEFEPDNPLALAATGFLGAGVHSTQITINLVEKERYDELDDIVRTMGTSMLGLTVGCARCHDHKYDPIPSKDYYRLLSTFTTTVRSEVDLKIFPPNFVEAKGKWDAEHAKILEPLTRYEKEQMPSRFEQWLAKRTKPTNAPVWTLLELVSQKSQGGATFSKLDDGSFLLGGTNPDKERLILVAHTQLKEITSIRLEALAHPSLLRGGPGRASNGNFALSDFKITAAPLQGGPSRSVKIVNARATFEQHGLPVKAAIDRDKTSAWAIDPQFGKNHAAVFDLEKTIGFEGGTVLTFTLDFNTNTGHGIGRPRLAVSTLPMPVAIEGEPYSIALQKALAHLEAEGIQKLSLADRESLLDLYRRNDPEWQALYRKVQEHRRSEPAPALSKALICSEGLPPIRLHSQGADFLTETHFLNRGDPNQKQGVATQGFLQVLMPAADQEKRWQVTPPPGARTSYRRRSLANWITDVDQGAGRLLARVIVNRLWQHHFGRGLAATPSDFGFQGDKPTHPELLDYLATELIASGWRLKPIHKLIVTSAVYRQGSQFDPERARQDPGNQLYWRQMPRRLEAEVVRDALLAVSETLDPAMFGPGTLDPNHRRRSIYFFVKRSQLIHMMVLFDAPDGLQGLEQRTTTTTAPQSLLLMNSRQVRDGAKAFAARIQSAGGGSVDKAFRLALARPPSEQERADSLQFIQEQLRAYEQEKRKDASALALTDFCQVLLELNEFIYVE